MFRIKQKNTPEGPCFTCRLIRSFILATIMLIILGLVASDRIYLVNFISTELIAIIILVLRASFILRSSFGSGKR